jgi:hypothetical protein
MQYKFQNEVVLPKKACEVNFITYLNIFPIYIRIIRTFVNLEKGSLRTSPNKWRLTAFKISVPTLHKIHEFFI